MTTSPWSFDPSAQNTGYAMLDLMNLHRAVAEQRIAHRRGGSWSGRQRRLSRSRSCRSGTGYRGNCELGGTRMLPRPYGVLPDLPNQAHSSSAARSRRRRRWGKTASVTAVAAFATQWPPVAAPRAVPTRQAACWRGARNVTVPPTLNWGQEGRPIMSWRDFLLLSCRRS